MLFEEVDEETGAVKEIRGHKGSMFNVDAMEAMVEFVDY